MVKKEEIEANLGGAANYVALATVSAKEYQQTNIAIVSYLTAVQKTPGVYVTLNKPFARMFELLQQNSVATEMIIFIDAVTKTAGGSLERTNRCLYIGNPENLSDISMAMDQAVQALPGKERFLFFDSLDTLLLYNKSATVAKFIHFLAGKMRVWKVKGIIISLSKESNKELIEDLTQFCDITMEL